jgi:hypothetical protein
VSISRQIEIIIGIIGAAVFTFFAVGVSILCLGSFSTGIFSHIQATMQAKMAFGVMTWGSFILANYVLLILSDAIYVNEVQKSHVFTLSGEKVRFH